MSWAILKVSRDRPSRKSPAIASRGAIADAVDEAVELRPGGRQVLEELVDLRVVADVAVEDQLGAEVRREFGDAVLEALAHVAEGEFRPLCVAGLGDAIGDGAVRQNAGDQQFLASEEAHKSLDSVKSRQNCRMRGLLLLLASTAGCAVLGRPWLCALGRPQVSARLHPLRLRQPGRAQGRRAAAGQQPARVHLRQVQPVHHQGLRRRPTWPA